MADRKTLDIRTFPSKSRPGLTHTVKLGKDDCLYCTCPSWKYQHKHPHDRACLHTRAVVADLARHEAAGFRKAA